MAEPASPHEVEAFERWLAADPAHARAYAEMDAVMSAAGSARATIERAEAGEAGRARLPIPRPALALALATVALLTAVALWQGTAEPAFAALSNTGVAVRGVRLADGTVVWLDVGARVGVRLADEDREIAVRQGRVRIAPAADPRPLRVSAEGTRIRPGTTRLDVWAKDGTITVTAIDGALTLALASRAGDSRSFRLAGGRAVALHPDGALPAVPDPRWPAGRLGFDAAPLGRILALANRLGDPDVAAADPEIAALRVSGVFDLRDTQRLARKLAATLDLELEEDAGRLVLRR